MSVYFGHRWCNAPNVPELGPTSQGSWSAEGHLEEQAQHFGRLWEADKLESTDEFPAAFAKLREIALSSSTFPAWLEEFKNKLTPAGLRESFEEVQEANVSGVMCDRA